MSAYTAALGTTEVTQTHTRHRLTSNIKPYEMTTLSFPTTRHRDGKNNDITAPHV